MENATGMGNLELYQQFRAVPDNAQRAITGGRLKGKTEINPMWRIKALTEVFGPCGIGWKYEITQKWLQPCEKTGEIAAFVDLNLYFLDKTTGAWSDAIPGTGGDIASWISYNEAKRWSKHPEEFGHGSLVGIAADVFDLAGARLGKAPFTPCREAAAAASAQAAGTVCGIARVDAGHIRVRLLAEKQPPFACRPLAPELEDVYLHYFGAEDAL